MYDIQLGTQFYTGFTLPQAWNELEGVGCARIWCGDRLVLERAGESVGRRYAVRRMYHQRKERHALERRDHHHLAV